MHHISDPAVQILQIGPRHKSMLPVDVSGVIKMVLVSEAWTSLLPWSQRRFGKLSSLLSANAALKMQAAPNNLAAQR